MSHAVKSGDIRFVCTFDLRQVRLKEKCVLIYALQYLKNHTKKYRIRETLNLLTDANSITSAVKRKYSNVIFSFIFLAVQYILFWRVSNIFLVRNPIKFVVFSFFWRSKNLFLDRVPQKFGRGVQFF